MNEQRVVNLERFRLTADTRQEAQDVFALFIRLTEERLEQLMQPQPAEFWRRTAHYLKGSAANLGMEALAAVCQAAELSPPSTLQEGAAALADMRREVMRVHAFFEEHFLDPLK